MDGNETSDSEIEIKDPMVVIKWSEGLIWDEGPFTNPHLWVKIRVIAHAQTVEVLTLMKKKVDPSSKMYKDMYLNIFKALIVKRIASKKKGTILLTPSATNLEDYME